MAKPFRLTVEFINRIVKDYGEGDLEAIAQEYGLRNSRHVRQIAQTLRDQGVPVPRRVTVGETQSIINLWASQNNVEIKKEEKEKKDEK